MFDLLITGGTVVTKLAVDRLDIGVVGGRIAQLGAPDTIRQPARETIDAHGKLVLPAGIEPHTHLAHFVSMRPDENLYTLGPEEDTLGMLFGGVTTHIDFCYVRPGSPPLGALDERIARWQDRSYTDYSFHVAFVGPHAVDAFQAVPQLVERGFPSFKVFTTDVLPRDAGRKPLRMDDGRIASLMDRVRSAGGILMVHAENDDLVQSGYERARALGQTADEHLHSIHSNLSERFAFEAVIGLAEEKRTATYFVHTSAAEGVDAIAAARRRGLPIYGETLHQYLCHTADAYRTPRGRLLHNYPSLKSRADQERLWEGLLGGILSTTASDELPTSRESKLAGTGLEQVTGGTVGAEARLGIVYTEGVLKRGMSLKRFVQVTSSNAAQLFGLYPRKGVIAQGSDADLVIFDPSVRKTLASDDFHVSDYSPWEGWEVTGWPSTTILRGRVVVADGRLRAGRDGQLIRRKIDPAVRAGPLS